MSNALKDFNDVGLLFPSEYLCAADLRGKDVVVTIAKIEPRAKLKRTDGTVEQKPVVTFAKATKKWVLNKTNARTIAGIHGKPLDWIGKAITLYATTCEAFGATVDCVRVKAAPHATEPVGEPPFNGDDGAEPDDYDYRGGPDMPDWEPGAGG